MRVPIHFSFSCFYMTLSAVNIILSEMFAYGNSNNETMEKKYKERIIGCISTHIFFTNLGRVKAKATNCFQAIWKLIALILPFIHIKIFDIKTLRVTYNFYLCLSHSKKENLIFFFSFIQSTNTYLLPTMCQILYLGLYQ